MPLIAFVDEEVNKAYETISSNEKGKDWFPAHSFEGSCLRAGISLSDLKERTFVSIMKILFSFVSNENKKNNNIIEATQDDIDKFMS